MSGGLINIVNVDKNNVKMLQKFPCSFHTSSGISFHVRAYFDGTQSNATCARTTAETPRAPSAIASRAAELPGLLALGDAGAEEEAGDPEAVADAPAAVAENACAASLAHVSFEGTV